MKIDTTKFTIAISQIPLQTNKLLHAIVIPRTKKLEHHNIGNENLGMTIIYDFHINIMLNFRLPIQNVNANTYLVPEFHAGMLV